MRIRSVAKYLKELHGATLEVGFVDSGSYNNGKSIAAVAAINEYGSEEANIPARAFMRHATAVGNATVSPVLKAEGAKLLAGNQSEYQFLLAIGEHYRNQIKRSITRGNWERNAESTIRKKGFDYPLVHSTTMLNSVVISITRGNSK